MNIDQTLLQLTLPPAYPSLHRFGRWHSLGKTRATGFVLAGALAWSATSASATDRHWTGAISSDWNIAANWNPAGLPQNGDNLIFDSSSRTTMTNNVVNLTVNTLTFPQDTDFFLYGSALTFTSLILDTQGSGTLTVNCPLIAQPGSQISSSTIASGSTATTAKLYLNQPVTINSGTLRLIASDVNGSAESSGSIFCRSSFIGGGDISAETYGNGSTGKIEFDAPLGISFTGTLYLKTATPFINFNSPSGTVVTNQLEVANGNTAKLNLSATNQIDSDAALIVTGGGKLLLSGVNAEVGYLILTNSQGDTLPSTIDTGTTTLTTVYGIDTRADSGSVTPTVKGTLRLSTVLNGQFFNIYGTSYAGLDMQAQIYGSAEISKWGNAALLLETNNPFTGGFSVYQGVLDVRNDGALGISSPIVTQNPITTLGGGSMTLRNVTIPTGRLAVDGNQVITPDTTGSFITVIGTCKWLGQIYLNSSLYVIANDLTLGGPLSGSGGLELSFGNVTITNSGSDNTYTGTTFVHCPLASFDNVGHKAFSGPLVVGGGLSTGCEARWQVSQQGAGSTITVYSNGVANLNSFNETISTLTLNGGRVETGSGQLTVNQAITANAANVTAIINGNLALGSGVTFPFNIDDGAAEPDLQINAVITGAPSQIQKQGAGTLALTAINSYTGVTVVNQGILEADTGSSLGNISPANYVQVQSNATCRLAGSDSTPKVFLLSGSGTRGTNGALEFPANSSYTLSGSVSLHSPATIGVGQSAGASLNGVINGSGPLEKAGPGILTFGGSANGYTGDTIVSQGTLYLSKPAFFNAVPGNLVIGPAPATSFAIAVLLQTGQIGGDTVTVNANSTFNANGYSQTLNRLNLNDGGSAQTGAGNLTFSSGGVVAVGSRSLFGSRASSSISGNIGLPANDIVTFIVNPYAPIFGGPTAPELDMTAFIPAPVEVSQFAPAGIAKSGFGQMRLSADNSYKGATIINAGTLRVDGSQPRSQILLDGGILSGIGTVGHLYPQAGSAVVSPGDSPGILTCSNFNAGASGPGTLQIELNGTTPGSGYDQLNVHGTVNLSGITLNASLNYSSSVSDQFIIINNDGSDAVTGTFTGLPQGKKLYIGNQLFQITYTGGTGNDAVLTRLVTPPPPTLAIQHVPPASVRLLWATNDPPFNLQTDTNLPATYWAAALPLPVVIGTNYIVTNSITDVQRFYRLSNP
jgi:fibronectin-binding autotransporter adhesin